MRDENAERRRIIDRAQRMLGQSRTLRKPADELLQESSDLRKAAKRIKERRRPKKR